MREYLVLDIGGTFIKYAMMDEKANILEKGKVPSPTQDSGQFFRVIEDIARPYQGRFHGTAVSVPGCIDRKRGIAITGGAFSFLQNTSLADLLQKRLGVPVTLANDAHCAAWAEVSAGSRRNLFWS